MATCHREGDGSHIGLDESLVTLAETPLAVRVEGTAADTLVPEDTHRTEFRKRTYLFP